MVGDRATYYMLLALEARQLQIDIDKRIKALEELCPRTARS